MLWCLGVVVGHVLELCEQCEGLYARQTWFAKNSMLVDELASALDECKAHAKALLPIIRLIYN
jgi:hypothetical protein